MTKTRLGRKDRVQRSEGVLVASFCGGVCVYDLLSNHVHVLAPAAARLLEQLPAEYGALLDVASDVVGPDAADPVSELSAGVAALVEVGILNRELHYVAPIPVVERERPAISSRVGEAHVVLDQVLAFRSSTPELLATIDQFMGSGPTTLSPPTVFIDVDARHDGGVGLYAAEEWAFPDLKSLLVQLPGVIHDFLPRVCRDIVLHAGAVRAPDGRLLVVPGGTEHGKATLVAGLVQRGCDYLGDEMTGIRAATLGALSCPTSLSLDEGSRSVLGLPPSASPLTNAQDLRSDALLLGGEVGLVDEVILPRFRPAEVPSAEVLEPIPALQALLENATNLHLAGEPGFATLCAVAESVPTREVVHGDSCALADLLVGRRAAADG